MLHTNIATLTSFASHLFSGIAVGMIPGIIVGLLTILSDAFFYSRHVPDFRLAKKYANPMVQFLVFMLINVVYAGVLGTIFVWLRPLLPSHWILRGLVFGVASYVVLSRHFTEGFAFMNPDYFPVNLSVYLSIEFLVIYVLQGILISIGIKLVSGIKNDRQVEFGVQIARRITGKDLLLTFRNYFRITDMRIRFRSRILASAPCKAA